MVWFPHGCLGGECCSPRPWIVHLSSHFTPSLRLHIAVMIETQYVLPDTSGYLTLLEPGRKNSPAISSVLPATMINLCHITIAGYNLRWIESIDNQS